LQLEGYLRSLYRYWPEALMQTVVVYKPELFEHEYGSVFKKFNEIRVVKERDFHSDVLSVLARTEAEYVLFGIDDVVFFDGLDFSIVDKIFGRAGDSIDWIGRKENRFTRGIPLNSAVLFTEQAWYGKSSMDF
jgi:hypothetical protein